MSAPLDAHRQYHGKLTTGSLLPLNTREDLTLAYSPGVAEPCLEIARDPQLAYDYTLKARTVAVISDGSAVLGLGNIGAAAGIPVMEGKAVLFKEFGGVDAFPICITTQDVEEFIETVVRIAPVFGGINLEDISAPRCFEIEERLSDLLDIPVFHDDQHGTAIVVLAGLLNAAKVTGKDLRSMRIAMSGAGAAGTAIVKLLLHYGVKDITVADQHGAIYAGREQLDPAKAKLAEITNTAGRRGGLADIVAGADVFIGVSKAGVMTQDMVRSMAPGAIVFGLANPEPEIRPELALAAGAAIVATGRSDYPNQINNLLAFPGIFRGLLDARVRKVTMEMKVAAAEAIAAFVPEPTADHIVPSPLDKAVAPAVAAAIHRFAGK